MCYLPYAKGGHAKHVETGQFTPPRTPSEEATDSQNQSLSMGAQGHDQVIKNSCGRVVEVHEGDADCLVLVRRGVPRPPPRGETTLKPPRNKQHARAGPPHTPLPSTHPTTPAHDIELASSSAWREQASSHVEELGADNLVFFGVYFLY